MRVFQSMYRDRKREKRKTQRWYVELQDHQQVIRRFPGFTSKLATTALGRNLERMVVYHRATGGQLDPALVGWLESLPVRTVKQLCRIGLIDAKRAGAAKPIAEHLDDFRRALLDKNNTPAYAKKRWQRARDTFQGIGATFLSEVTADAVQHYLAGRRNVDLSIATSNHYLSSVQGFFRWLVRERRLTESPVSHLRKLNAETDRKRKRRPLEPNDFIRLITTTIAAPTRFNMTGPERALCYRVATETGFRANEIHHLTKASFELGGDEPTVTCEAGYSKRRREDVLPLRQDIVAELRAFFANKLPDARAFNLPKSDRTCDMLRADLADAGIPFEDDAGRVIDFQALRSTFASNLAAADVHPRTAQELLRHSTIDLTMNVYTHVARGKLAAAVEALPKLDPRNSEAGQATGTDNMTPKGVLAPSLAPREKLTGTSVDSGGRKVVLSPGGKVLENKEKTGFSSGRGYSGASGGTADAGDLKSPGQNLQTLSPEQLTEHPQSVLAPSLALLLQNATPSEWLDGCPADLTDAQRARVMAIVEAEGGDG